MRALFALALLPALAVGCTPYIPVKDDFGISALVPAGQTPPEYAEFNIYDPAVNQLVSDQMCATPYEPLENRMMTADPGRLAQLRGRCRTHVPLVGSW